MTSKKYQEEMEVKDLSIQTKEDLSHALEKLTLNWEELMRSNTFASIYSENDINKIRMTGFCPANALIEDIISREIPLKVLLRGLLEIGNRKAISIIEKDMMSKGFYVEDSGGRPPPPAYICRQPEEQNAEGPKKTGDAGQMFRLVPVSENKPKHLTFCLPILHHWRM